MSLLLLPLSIYPDMEQDVAASVYNKCLNNQSVTKPELAKYQTSLNPTNQIDSLKKEVNKKLFAKGESLVYKILSFPCVQLSISQTLVLDGAETGV